MIVFPMAGLSSRFTKAGYDKPKWMLPLADRPLFDWSLLGFSEFFKNETFLIIYLEQPGTEAFIRERCNAMGVHSVQLVGLAAPTLGQADTVRLGLNIQEVAEETPITIFNIDTLRPKFAYPKLPANTSGWLETFIGEGDHWSFVLPNEAELGLAEKVVEKQRISPYCCSGIYHFNRSDLFLEALAQEENEPSMSELYVAPLYQRMIAKGHRIGYSVIQTQDIFFSGTPAEYLEAANRSNQIQSAFNLNK